MSARRDAAHATRKAAKATTSTAKVVAIVNLTRTSVTGLDWAGWVWRKQTPKPNSQVLRAILSQPPTHLYLYFPRVRRIASRHVPCPSSQLA